MTSASVRMLAMIEGHNPRAEGAAMRDTQPWPAYAVALTVAAIDDATCSSTTPQELSRLLGMRPSSAARHLRNLAKDGLVRKDEDGGYIPAWVR